MEIYERLSREIVEGQQSQVQETVREALDQGLDVTGILNQGLMPGMDEVGDKFQAGQYYIPHMLLAARAMTAALDILRPKLVETGAKPVGKVVLGTVQGDHHDIGKNLVRMMLEGKGFEVVDLGMDTSPDQFVAAADDTVDVIGLSCLLSTTAPFVKETIEALEKAGLRDRIKVIIGGGVVTQKMADDYGADAYGQDAARGAAEALALVRGER
jgi:5-methyltetrahydrofolate--homocysteine methyltransferase